MEHRPVMLPRSAMHASYVRIQPYMADELRHGKVCTLSPCTPYLFSLRSVLEASSVLLRRA